MCEVLLSMKVKYAISVSAIYVRAHVRAGVRAGVRAAPSFGR